MKETKHCHQCGNQLPPHKFRYCNDDCRDIYRGRERKSPTECVICEGELPEGRRKYCSDPCYDEGRRERNRLNMRKRRKNDE